MRALQKYYDMLHQKQLPKPCRAVIGEFRGDPVYCGRTAPHLVTDLPTGAEYAVCDKHLEEAASD